MAKGDLRQAVMGICKKSTKPLSADDVRKLLDGKFSRLQIGAALTAFTRKKLLVVAGGTQKSRTNPTTYRLAIAPNGKPVATKKDVKASDVDHVLRQGGISDWTAREIADYLEVGLKGRNQVNKALYQMQKAGSVIQVGGKGTKSNAYRWKLAEHNQKKPKAPTVTDFSVSVAYDNGAQHQNGGIEAAAKYLADTKRELTEARATVARLGTQVEEAMTLLKFAIEQD